MTAGAKSQAGIQFEHQSVGLGRIMPAGHNPDVTADVDRFKLGLRQPDPVLFRHFAQ